MTARSSIVHLLGGVALVAAILFGFGLAAFSCSRVHAADYVVETYEKPILLAQADTADAGVEAAPSSPAPADKLHDPIAAPKAAWDDVKAAKKMGWPVLVFAVLVMLAKLLGRAKKYKLLAALGKGKVAVVVGAVGALGTACYNAAAEGGAWSAMLLAGLVAIGHYLDAGEKKPDGGGN